MARRGGGHDVKYRNTVDGMFEGEEAAQPASLIEDRIAWNEYRFETFAEQVTRRIDALMATALSQSRTQNPTPRRVGEDCTDGRAAEMLGKFTGFSDIPEVVIKEGIDNPFGSYNPHLYPEDFTLSATEFGASIVDWDSPPIYDEYKEGKVIKKMDFESVLFVTDGVIVEEPGRVTNVCSVPSGTSEYSKTKAGSIDFIGVEYFLSTSFVLNLILYKRISLMMNHIRRLMWASIRKIDELEYSKYLFTWSGQLQYLRYNDPSNSRPNFPQQWENDGEWIRGGGWADTSGYE